jgi:type IV pilus assembly protein PilN
LFAVSVLLVAIGIVIIMRQFLIMDLQFKHHQIEQLQRDIAQQNQLLHHLELLQKNQARFTPLLNTLTILQTDRQQTSQLFNELTQVVPAGVYITSLSRQNQQLALVGKTVTSAQLTELMQNINQSNWLMHPQIISIVADTTTPPYQSNFEIQLQLKQAFPDSAALDISNLSNSEKPDNTILSSTELKNVVANNTTQNSAKQDGTISDNTNLNNAKLNIANMKNVVPDTAEASS